MPPMYRVCWDGHRGYDARATICPKCHKEVSGPALTDTAGTGSDGLPGAGRSWTWATGGTAATAGGIALLVAGSDDGLQVAGAILLAFGQGALLIGVVGLGVFNGMLDFHERKEAAERRRGVPDE